MKNEVYEKDYSAVVDLAVAQSSDTGNELFDHILKSDFFKKFDQAMKSTPKIISAKDRESYEALLPRLDAFAKEWDGKIRGVVDYERWQSDITVTLPFFEFSSPDDFALLADIASKSNLVTIKAAEDGSVILNIMINYFEELGDPDEIMDGLIQQDHTLVELLEKEDAEKRAKLQKHLFPEL